MSSVDTRPINSWTKTLTLVVVFFGGGVMMSLEIVGSRVIAPYYGNSVYIWGSLIGVFLTALSLGALLGGWLSQRGRSEAWIQILCLLTSICILPIPQMGVFLCEKVIGHDIAPRWGALIAAFLLFSLPSTFLGSITPLAMRIFNPKEGQSGRIAGQLFAVSTFGSIAGTFATTFFLIEACGTQVSIRLLAGIMAFWPILFLLTRQKRMSIASGSFIVYAFLFILPWSISGRSLYQGEKVVQMSESPYHHISVVDTPSGKRQLRFDSYVESSVYLKDMRHSAALYTEGFRFAELYLPESPEHALFIGAGAGVSPAAFKRRFPNMGIEVIDIDPEVIRLCKEYFEVPEMAALEFYADDGRQYIRRSNKKYDMIALDAFSIGGRIPFHLTTREYFFEIKNQLTPEGLLTMNINSALRGPESGIYQALLKTLQQVFPEVVVLPVTYGSVKVQESCNILFFCSESPKSIKEWKAMGYQLNRDIKLSDMNFARQAGEVLLAEIPTDEAPLLTDDYAPVDHLKF